MLTKSADFDSIIVRETERLPGGAEELEETEAGIGELHACTHYLAHDTPLQSEASMLASGATLTFDLTVIGLRRQYCCN